MTNPKPAEPMSAAQYWVEYEREAGYHNIPLPGIQEMAFAIAYAAYRVKFVEEQERSRVEKWFFEECTRIGVEGKYDDTHEAEPFILVNTRAEKAEQDADERDFLLRKVKGLEGSYEAAANRCVVLEKATSLREAEWESWKSQLLGIRDTINAEDAESVADAWGKFCALLSAGPGGK